MNSLARTLLAGLALMAIGTACGTSIASKPIPKPDSRTQNSWFEAGRKQVAESARFVRSEPAAKNVILFVGDG